MSISIFNRLAKVLLLTQYDVSMHRTLTTSSKREHSVLLKSVASSPALPSSSPRQRTANQISRDFVDFETCCSLAAQLVHDRRHCAA